MITTPHISSRKEKVYNLYQKLASTRDFWIKKSPYFYTKDRNYLKFLIPDNLRVLALGCGTGQLLAQLNPKHGVGIDISDQMIEQAKTNYPHLEFHVGDVENKQDMAKIQGTFDVIVIADTLGLLDDCEQTLQNSLSFCHRDTRIVITYYSMYWGPFLRLAEKLKLKMPQPEFNWLSTENIENLLHLANFEVLRKDWKILVPWKLFGLGTFINHYIATFPIIRRLCLRNYIVARPLTLATLNNPSTTIVIPCRNEAGNIEAAIQRTPKFCNDIEFIFVEGNSQDNTFAEAQRVAKQYAHMDIKVFQQPGIGKADAVYKGFAHARGEILMILDADLTMPPEALPKFYHAIISGKGNFINGSRLVYPMEKQAMRFLNMIANIMFSILFSWLLNQRVTDTLCGTKVFTKAHYLKIQANRHYFGDFDPFGDFDLLFGASKLNLKIIDVPIRYASRTYGETQISRFRHGLLLIRMVIFAYRKLKAL